MPDKKPFTSTRTRELHSPILYFGKISITEPAGAQSARPLSGTRLKAIVFPLMHWLIRHLPVSLALLPVRLVTTLVFLMYALPGNRLRVACQHICQLGKEVEPERTALQVYREFLANAVGVLDNFFTLYRHGSEPVLPRVQMEDSDIHVVESLIKQHGGIVLAVPHNIGSAFSALRIGHCFDMLLVAKNSPTVERTRIALDFYEKMNLSLLMVREGHPLELSRAMLTCLRSGKLVAATLDNIDRTPRQIPVTLFGEEVGLSDWAARIAARMQVPVVPAWFSSQGKHIRVRLGQPLVCDDIGTAVQHYARFFEQQILRDPASWAYLADKHWQKVLRRALGKSSTT